MVRERKTIVSVRLPEDLVKWLRRKAAEGHTTVSSIVVSALREKRDYELAETFARAALKAACALLSLTGRDPSQVDWGKVRSWEVEVASRAAAQAKALRGEGEKGT
ncbi:CopG domain protein DNA-binding domain protein (plasmid) [Ammonifex degensii KC4]|uniref:CopG domain protein DNA-binding domain protein n=1 Tax=Ammonifex degensii (strain DSM 10501 / KC4) TaxID=429009 RepID=C9RDH3_AMMDK|nr:CopG family transcriptional regulator [Ammonifex degensii]ACX53244.1 CopG domain protein DNA-binding domain protein [Ammonifex degensii KC4]